MSVFPAAADPVSMVPESLERGSWCNEHMIHERLDIIEEVRGIVLAPESHQTSVLSLRPEKKRPFLTLSNQCWTTCSRCHSL